jgi:hypothetical protein
MTIRPITIERYPPCGTACLPPRLTAVSPQKLRGFAGLRDAAVAQAR